MANSLDIPLEGKVVIFKQRYLKVPATEHPFRVDAGFGASPGTTGTALAGEFLSDGEHARMEGFMVDRLATQEEIDSAFAIRGVVEDPQSPFHGLVQQEAKS